MPCDPQTQNCRATGKVRRIYARNEGAFIRLKNLVYDGPPPEEDWRPEMDVPGGERYFELRRGHPNYNALYSLVLVAATNKYTLSIRTEDPIDPTSNENAVVSYLVVNW